MPRILVCLLLLGATSGCDLLTGPDAVVGAVRSADAPEAVSVGQAFTVTVTTTGPSGCWEKDRTEIDVSGLTATVTPYDVDTRSNCTQAPVELTHTAEVTFDQSGQGVVTVRGRADSGLELNVAVE